MDHVLSTNRWNNSITDIAADHNANIYSDHYPLIIETRMKLKAQDQIKTKPRPKYSEHIIEHKEQINIQFKEILEQTQLTLKRQLEQTKDG